MWIFTPYGFFSAVCARQGDGAKPQPVDLGRVMVRTRRREHLESLAVRFPDQLRDAVILDSSGTDYRFRVFIPKTAWRKIIVELVAEMDYDNFKSKVSRTCEDLDYTNALHDVWSVMYQLQP